MTASRNRRSPMLRLLCLGIAQCLYAAPVLAQSLPGTMTANTNVSAPVTNGNTMTVNVTGSRAYAEWNSFNVAAGNTFQITNSGGPNNYIFVNRVTGGTASDISGLVQGNGHFWLLNPNGISVGSTGVFDVGGLLLSTATTLNGETEATNGAAFFAGATNTFSFGGAAGNIIVQRGAQLTADIGAIALLANQVTFGGTANAGTGETAIIGAQAATVGFDADLNAFSTLTLNTGSNQGTGVRVGGNSQFTAARTFITAAGMADAQGNILLVDDNAADNISFVGGDLVLYAGMQTGASSNVTVYASGTVQPGPGALAGAAKLLIQGGINAPGRLDIVSSGGVGQGGTDLIIYAAGNLSIRSDI
jgi:filamentous hemagglutinin family protein